MLYEFAIMPQIFSKEYIKDIAIQKDLIHLLKDIKDIALIANLNRGKWHQEVREFLNYTPPNIKEKINALLKNLYDNNRIVEHTKIKDILESEDEWLELAMEENNIYPFYAIITTKNRKIIDNQYTIEELENDIVDNLKSDISKVEIEYNSDNLEKIYKQSLLYARKLTIIDPYFTYNKFDEETLYMIAEYFGKRRGERLKKRKIIIHTIFNTKDYNNNPEDKNFQNRWIEICKSIYERYGYIVTINFWENADMHDRYLITDQTIIHSGRGFSIVPRKTGSLNLINYSKASYILDRYNQYANKKISLKLKIDKDINYNEESLFQIGIVKKIIKDNDKKVGFIQYNQTEDIFFNLPKQSFFSKLLDVGVKVKFEIKKNYKGKSAYIKSIL